MQKLSYLLFLLAIVSSCCTAQYIQSHSFNDLDYIGQQLLKGVDAFKLDVNAMDYATCITYSTWKKSDNACERNDNNIDICCLGLRGDTSSGPRLDDYFNTTNNFIDFLNDERYDFIWNKDKRLEKFNRTVYIAINVQYNFVQGELTKHWAATMVQTIQKRNLDIQIIIGREDFLNYWAGLCKNKSKLCDAEAQAIADYHWVLQGSGLTPDVVPFGYEENFNVAFPGLQFYCNNFFPSYGDSEPYFFYEVAHQDDIHFIVNTYMSSSCNRSASHSDMTRVRITSNVDPEHLENYLPKANPDPFNNLKTATNILIDTYVQDQSIILSYFDNVTNSTHVQIRSSADPNQLTLIAETTIDIPYSVKMSYKAPFLMLQNNGFANIYSVNNSGSSISLQTLSSVAVTGYATDFVTYNDSTYLIEVDSNGRCPDNTLSFSISNIQKSQEVIFGCSDIIKPFSVNEIQSAKLSAAADTSGNLAGILFVSASYTYLNQVKDAIFSFTFNTNLATHYLTQAFTIVTPKSYLDFGVDPDVKVINDNGVLFVLEGHSNGLCQCGNVLNNGNTFKCGVSNTQNPHRAYYQNVDYMMNYNWGKLDDFITRTTNGQFVSGCDKKIMHAKFYNGQKPNGVVFRNGASGALQALFVNEYIDYDDLPLISRLFCGANLEDANPKATSSIVANNFNIVDFDLFNYF